MDGGASSGQEGCWSFVRCDMGGFDVCMCMEIVRVRDLGWDVLVCAIEDTTRVLKTR